MAAHLDWVFDTAWIDPSLVATASRDNTIKLWRVPDPYFDEYGAFAEPLVTARFHGLVSAHAMIYDIANIQSLHWRCIWQNQMLLFCDTYSAIMSRAEHVIHHADLSIHCCLQPPPAPACHKVRALRYNAQLGFGAAITTTGFLDIFEPETLAPVRTLQLSLGQNVPCMDLRRDLCAICVQDGIQLLDLRAHSHCQDNSALLPNLDRQGGVRTLGMCGHLLTAGTSSGKIFFYDLRTHKALDHEPPLCFGRGAELSGGFGTAGPSNLNRQLQQQLQQPGPPGSPLGPGATQPRLQQEQELLLSRSGGRRHQPMIYTIGKGCLDDNYNAATPIPLHIAQATSRCVYAHAWDSRCSRLFTCGGPIVTVLKGNYMSFWM